MLYDIDLGGRECRVVRRSCKPLFYSQDVFYDKIINLHLVNVGF